MFLSTRSTASRWFVTFAPLANHVADRLFFGLSHPMTVYTLFHFHNFMTDDITLIVIDWYFPFNYPVTTVAHELLPARLLDSTIRLFLLQTFFALEGFLTVLFLHAYLSVNGKGESSVSLGR